MATNMFRVGDYVYVETSPTSPYYIRRIEELNKNQSGNVEAKVMCFYRRRDLPNSLVQLADKHQPSLDEDNMNPINCNMTDKLQSGNIVMPSSTSTDKGESLTAKQHYQIKHRELFLSRQVETIPATHIRGKCSVTLFNETESLQSYLNKDDTFFYCLVFDPTQKTLLADKGEIRVGSRYQSDIPPKLKEINKDDRKFEDIETLMWSPNHNLNDRKIDQFLVVSRSIGTFARALDCSSSVKQPSLHMSAAAASRDITLFHAMDTLHRHNYSIEDAMCSLVPSTGPVLCRDEIEDWSASEANLFEEALDKYGKDFNDIRQDFLPWKTLKQIIEYYYMWKTTDRYVQQKRVKAVEAELKLKQVYIPQYNIVKNSISSGNGNSMVHGSGGSFGSGSGCTSSLKSSNTIYNGITNSGTDVSNINKPCESCCTLKSSQWFSWSNGHLLSRLCISCWDYWKKYGGLKNYIKPDIAQTEDLLKKKPIDEDDKVNDLSNRQTHKCSFVNCSKEFKLKTHLARHYAQAHGIAISSGSPRPIMKTRTAFYLQANPMTRLARIICRNLIKPKKAARQTSYAINGQMIRHEFNVRMIDKSADDIKKLLFLKKKHRGSVTKIANRLGSPGIGPHEWLILTPKDKMPKPDLVLFPKPPKASDGSLLYDRIPNKIIDFEKDLTIIPAPTSVSSTLRKRIHMEKQLNGTEVTIIPVGLPPKRANKDPMPSHCPSPEQFAAILAASGQTLQRHQLNGKPKIAQMARTGNGRKQVISWMDAPDDVYFRATETCKKSRKLLLPLVLRRAARKPWRIIPISKPIITNRQLDTQVVVLD